MTNTISKTIYEQLGGNKFAQMTGSKYFMHTANSLTFRVTKNAENVNAVRITLNADDLYTCEFYCGNAANYKLKSHFTNVGADQLCGIFTLATGLYTSLFPN